MIEFWNGFDSVVFIVFHSIIKYNQTLYAWVYGFKHHFRQYFSYNVVVSFIGGGSQSTRREFVSDLQQVGGFLQVLRVPPPI